MLQLTGRKKDVTDAATALRQLIAECKLVVTTVPSKPLTDKANERIGKLIDKLDKSSAVVTVVGDSTTGKKVEVTGTTDEINACREKLKKLGVTFDGDDKGSTCAIPPDNNVRSTRITNELIPGPHVPKPTGRKLS